MNVNFRYPNITASSEKEQIAQIKSYLHQLVEQLNNELPNVGSGNEEKQEVPSTYEVQGTEMSYYELRSLILKDLQEVQRLVEELEAEYVKRTGWQADRYLVTDANGNVNPAKITFAIDEDGYLYYEVEE